MTDEFNADESATETPVSIDDELGSIFDEANAVDEGQPRDTEGKFAAKDEAAPVEAAPEAAQDAPEQIQADPGTDAETEAAPQALEAPASWTAAAKERWPDLTPEVQAEVLRREGDWQRTDGERAEKIKRYESIDAALEPVRQNLELNGVEPAQYVRQLAAADQYLRTNPQEAIQWLAQQYNIDLAQMNADPAEADPYTAPLVGEINQLKAQQAQFFEAQRQQELARRNQEIEAFAQDKPLFDDVVDDMARLAQANPGMDLAGLYEQAVWANPTTRAKMIAEQTAESERKRAEEAAERSAKAKRVTATNLNSHGTAAGATPTVYESRDDELSDIYDRVAGAA